MKQNILLLSCLMASATLSAQEISITPSLGENKQIQFQFSPDESYFLIQLSDEVRPKLKEQFGLTDDNFVWMGADPDNGRNIWSWEETVVWADANGSNWYGQTGGYQSWRVGSSKGWSGLGYNVAANGAPMDLHWINSDYSFHMALRSFTSQSIDIYLTDGYGTEAHLVFGQSAYDGVDPVADFPRDGNWYDIEIPMTYLEDQYEFTFDGATAYVNKNYLCALVGKSPGLSLDFDACFFHGPKAPVTSVIEVEQPAEPTAIQAVQYGKTQSCQRVYDLQGRPIRSARRDACQSKNTQTPSPNTRQVIINAKRKVIQ